MKDKTAMRIAFTGDICFDKYFCNGWENPDCLGKEIDSFLRTSDYVVANIEGPLTKKIFERKNTQVHASDPNAGLFLYQHNMRIWNLGNNHMMDCAQEGLIDTLACSKENLCRTIGAGNTIEDACRAVVVGNETKIGIISIAKPWPYIIADDTQAGVFTWEKTETLKKIIRQIREEVQWVIIVAHGGDEFSDLPVPEIREKYHQLLKLGADIIVGHHPHVLQPYERVDNKLIFYSLGNFIFDTDYQRHFLHTDFGIVLSIDFNFNEYKYSFMPVHINRKKQIVEMAADIPAIFREINEHDYEMLWPVEAKRLFLINREKWLYTQNKFKRAGILLSTLHMLYGLRHKHNRTIFKGMLHLARQKQSGLAMPEIYNYLLQN